MKKKKKKQINLKLITKNFQKLEQLSVDRGTSLSVLLKSYNLHNGNDEKEKQD